MERSLLLIEDNPGDVELIRLMLAEARRPWSLKAVPRLATALELLAREPFDAVLLDLGLPDSSGVETFVRAQAERPELPYIVLTGLDREELAAEAIARGAQDYLVKGAFDGPLLVRAVNYAVERKQVSQRLAESMALSEALNRINTLVHSSLDPVTIRQRTLQEALAVLGVEAAVIGLKEGSEFVVRNAYGLAPSPVGERYPIAEMLALHHAEKEGVAVAFNHARSDPRVNLAIWGRYPVVALAVAPLMLRERSMGALAVFSLNREEVFNDRMVDFLRKLAASLALALDNANAYQTLARMQRKAKLLGDVLEHSSQPFVMIYPDGRIRYANRAWLDLVGRSWEEAARSNWHELVPAGQREASLQRVASLAGREEATLLQAEVVHRSGARIPVEVLAHPAPPESDEVPCYYLFVTDITERKRMEEQIRHMAHHDALTGLPNRRLFSELAAVALAQAQRKRVPFALLFLDLDHFKQVNDTLGHAVGDQLLVAAAKRLRAALRGSDVLARIGGDEFSVLLTEVQRGEAVAEVVRNLSGCFAQPFELSEQTLHVSSSIGISLFPEDGTDLETLLRHADLAMYHAKEQGRNRFEFFNPALNEHSQSRFRAATRLRQSLPNRELQLLYQPQVELSTRRLVGGEALVRWQHPEQGLLEAAAFVPLAEEIGFIGEIDRWVIQAACAQLHAWCSVGLDPVPITINLSGRQFQSAELAPLIGQSLRDNDLRPGALRIEVSESVAMGDVDQALARMQELAAVGIAIALDDFGSGCSSLSHLQRMPVASVKINRSFVRDIEQDPSDRATIRAVTAMAHTLQLRVIAEGVESAEQLAFLDQAECDEAQGYLFSRPLPPDAFAALMQQ